MKKAFPFILFLLFTSFTVRAAGTSGFQFLKTQTGARAAGMAGAFLAVHGDVSNLYYNPAGIASITQKQGSFTYTNELLDFNSGFIGYVHPNTGPGNAGVSLLYKDYGTFDETDINNQKIGQFGSNSFALSGSYATEIMKNLYAGASLKYLYMGIHEYSATGLAVDGGLLYRIPSQMLTFAFGVNHLGTMLSSFVDEKFPLPIQIRAGLSKRLAHLPLLLGFNVYKYNDEDWNWALGGEFTLTDNLYLRWGYDSFGSDLGVESAKDTFAGAAVGLGFEWRTFRLDYAFSNLGELGSLNRFTLSSSF